MKLLAGDIGGTKTALAIFDVDHPSGPLTVAEERVYPSKDFETFDDVLHRFRDDTGISAERAAFGVAGPVVGDSVRVTNLPWRFDASGLAREHGVSVRLVNDLVANARGLDELDKKDLIILTDRNDSTSGNRALVSPGTGLGVAGLFWDGVRHRPFPTENGHVGFGPETDQEKRLLEFAAARRSRVSWEDVISGPGLSLLYDFIVADGGYDADAEIRDAIERGEGPPAVTRRGLDGSSRAADETVRLYIRLLGSAVGNAAMQYFATGGMFVGGGIAPRLVHRFEPDGFLQAFAAKAPMEELLGQISVRVVMSSKAALLGAARIAAED